MARCYAPPPRGVCVCVCVCVCVWKQSASCSTRQSMVDTQCILGKGAVQQLAPGNARGVRGSDGRVGEPHGLSGNACWPGLSVAA